MKPRFLIYALTDPDGAVRYVGKSSSGLRRPRAHAAPSQIAHKTHRAAWMRSLLLAGQTHGILVLEELPSQDGLCEAERRWIAHGRAHGWRLTNLTDGGDGTPGRAPTAETRARQSAAARNRTPEARARMSASAKQRAGTPEGRAHLLAARRRSAGFKGQRLSDERKAVIRAAQSTPERIALLVDRNRRMEWTPEMRAKVSAARKRNVQNPPKAKRLEHDGEVHSIAEWSRLSGVPYKRLLDRIGKLGWPIAKALTASRGGGQFRR